MGVLGAANSSFGSLMIFKSSMFYLSNKSWSVGPLRPVRQCGSRRGASFAASAACRLLLGLHPRVSMRIERRQDPQFPRRL